MEFYECFPVKEYSSTPKAINNCNKFFNSTNYKRDVYIATVVYILYPVFEHKVTQLGCIFRGVSCSYDDLWRELKNSDFYDRVKQEFPNMGYVEKTLFEPIFVAERNVNEKEWKCINLILTEEENKEIMNSLNNGDYND